MVGTKRYEEKHGPSLHDLLLLLPATSSDALSNISTNEREDSSTESFQQLVIRPLPTHIVLSECQGW